MPGAEMQARAATHDPASRIGPWLASIGRRLRENFGDFPDAIWLTTPGCTLAAEREEDGRWSVDPRPAPAASSLRLAPAGLQVLHEVADAACDPLFDGYPTALLWPMARRLCRLDFDDTPAGDARSVMMLVGSLPGRMSEADRSALLDWMPAAGAMLAMVVAADASR